MRARSAALAAIGASLASAVPAAAAPHLSDVGSFTQPVYVAAPPGDPHRLFVVEKLGRIRVIVDAGAPKQVLDIRPEVDAGSEGGLLSMAFAPDYATSGRFYVYFNIPRPGDDPGNVVRVEEIRRSASDPDAADLSTRRLVLTIDHPSFGNHDGGQMNFGPDGKLWIGTGDGGGPNDPGMNAQNTHSLLGKLLRIDPTPTQTQPYTIPADNPYADGVVAAPEVWAYGLRNPWRWSFDRQTGDLVVGDVGQDAREEVDFSPRGTDAGVDYGWRCREGSIANPNISPPCMPSGTVVDPVFDYTHSAGRCSLTGGYVVRDPDLPTLAGRYLYADYCTGELFSLVLARPAASGNRVESMTVAGVSSFGEDSCGHVYVASVDTGKVFRIDDTVFTPCPEPPAGGGPGAGGPGGGGPGGGGTGGGGTESDTTAPVLSVDRAHRQRLLGRRAIYVAVRCDEDCGLTTGASVSGLAFRALSRAVPAGRRTRLKLKVSTAMRRVLPAEVASGGKPLVRVRLVARDRAGNEARKTVHVRVVG